MNYNLIRKQKEDQELYEKTYQVLSKRIQFKIDERLGIKGSSMEEVKVECKKSPDQFTKVLADLEDLDKDRTLIKKELDIISDYFEEIDRSIARMNSKEKKVFKAIYLHGLSKSDAASQLDCSEKTIQRLIKKIEEN